MKSIDEINVENISYKKPLKVDKGKIHYLKYENEPLIIRTNVLSVIDQVDDYIILDLDEKTNNFFNGLEYKIVDDCRQNHSEWGIQKQRYKSIIKELDNDDQVMKVNISRTNFFDTTHNPLHELVNVFEKNSPYVELIIELEGVFISENIITLLIKCYQGKVIDKKIDTDELDVSQLDTESLEYSSNPLSLPEEYSSSLEFY